MSRVDEATSDPWNLNRFVEAQEQDYARALAEIASGQKRTHWMWYIFPQLAVLGVSETARFYALKNRDEARPYLAHPLLGPRLSECAQAALSIEGRSAHDIFGSPDDLKLHSSATLFAEVSEAGSVFHRLLEKYFGGEPDRRTVELLRRDAG